MQASDVERGQRTNNTTLNTEEKSCYTASVPATLLAGFELLTIGRFSTAD